MGFFKDFLKSKVFEKNMERRVIYCIYCPPGINRVEIIINKPIKL